MPVDCRKAGLHAALVIEATNRRLRRALDVEPPSTDARRRETHRERLRSSSDHGIGGAGSGDAALTVTENPRHAAARTVTIGAIIGTMK